MEAGENMLNHEIEAVFFGLGMFFHRVKTVATVSKQCKTWILGRMAWFLEA